MMPLLVDVDLFPELQFCKKSTEEPKSEPTKQFLYAETFLEKVKARSRDLISQVDDLFLYDDIDSISDAIEEFEKDLDTIDLEIDFCKKNPVDLFFGFQPKKTKPKFRRYANHKRTNQRLGKTKIW